MKNWSEIIRAVRFHQGLSVEQLAKKISVTNGYVKMIEAGERTPSFNLLNKIETATGIPTSFIILLANYETLQKDFPPILKCLLDDDLFKSLFVLLRYCENNSEYRQQVTSFRNNNKVARKTE